MGALLKMAPRLTPQQREWVLRANDNKCGLCQTLVDVYEVDHLLPQSCDGGNEASNLWPLCPTCHSRKSAIEGRRVRDFKSMKQFLNPSYRLCYWCLEAYPWRSPHVCGGREDFLAALHDATPSYDIGRHKVLPAPADLSGEELPATSMTTDEERQAAMQTCRESLNKFRYTGVAKRLDESTSRRLLPSTAFT